MHLLTLRRMRTGVLVAMVLLLAGLGTAVDAGAAQPGAAEVPVALMRPTRPSDALPPRLKRALPSYAQARLVATYGTGKKAGRLYLVQTTHGYLCSVLLFDTFATGTGCMPPEAFFGGTSGVAAVSGRYFAGVASNDVAKVVLVQRDRKQITVALSADHGFIVGCTGPDQCACAVAWVDAYNASGVLVSHEHWLAPQCWRVK
jgi:hypothetical protein